MVKILGIESSCDETAAAIVENGQKLLSNVVQSQIDIHAEYGGVIPEIAARSHIEAIRPVITEAFSQSSLSWDDIDGIAVTTMPGLVGSLLIGSLAARSLAIIHHKPLYAIHHVEAHVYANFITQAATSNPSLEGLSLPRTQPTFPLLALIVSGGHTQLVLFKNHGDYALLGQTQDDAVGEAFDKVAKIIGLPYPGGPAIAKAAASGNETAFTLPKARLSGEFDFSFSGLKTAVLRTIQKEVGVDISYPSFKLPALVSPTLQADMAASFQRTAIATLVDKTEKAFYKYNPASVVIAGGVAANQALREELARRLPLSINYAPVQLCTDNAAMIATLGYYMHVAGKSRSPYGLEVVPSISMSQTAWGQAADHPTA